ncbi:MAG: aspartate aminotransferase family protein [Planctomycetota bacterium]
MSPVDGNDALRREAEHGPLVFGSRGLAIVRGEGATLWDDRGNRYHDCGSMIGVTSTGHSHPRVAAAIAEQAGRLISCFSSFANDRRGELYEALSDVLPFARRFYLCNSGTEALEAAIKLGCASTGRTGLAYVEGGFHGRTLGAVALATRPQQRAAVEPILPPARRVRFDDLADLEAAITEDTALFVAETIQGEGGVRPMSAEFLRRASELCRERGALYVADEVQCGVARTGRWFGFEHAEVEPDLVMIAKGLGSGVPIGCLAMGPRLHDAEYGVHGTTFGGNPLAAAAALATLEVMRDEDLLGRATRLGEIAFRRLEPLIGRVRAVRGRGAMIGVELRGRANDVVKTLQDRGVIALAAGPTVLRLLPPLVMSDAQWEEALDVIVDVLGS